MDQSVLVATFIQGRTIESTVEQILDNFQLTKGKIFLLQDKENPKKYILTYNILKKEDEFEDVIPNTIFLHRKKDTNTLYSLNALNEVVKSQNDGVIDKDYMVDWSPYYNSILLTKRPDEEGEDTLRVIRTKLLKIYKDFDEFTEN